MRTLVVNLSLSLDGVMQAPGRPDEDTRGNFAHGGWATPYFDPVMAGAAAEGMSKHAALLFGRRTYQDFFAVWPKRTDNPFTPVLNNSRKYVASRTLQEPLPWENSTLLRGDAAVTVAALKAERGPDLVVLGSGQLVQTLLRAGLVDQLELSIHPLVLGSGRRLFREGGPFAKLRLTGSQTTTTGVVMATYRPA
jgi:dihydrofolate reductase